MLINLLFWYNVADHGWEQKSESVLAHFLTKTVLSDRSAKTSVTLHSIRLIRVFHSLYKVGSTGSIGIKGFNNSKKLPPVGLDLMQEIIAGLGVQCLTNGAKLAFACKCDTIGSLYSHAVMPFLTTLYKL